MILYDYFRSSCAYRVRIALNLKGLAYQRRPIDLRANGQQSADYLARNPAGLVPALAVDGVLLTQSIAILDWLDSRTPAPRLFPTEPAARARVMALALAIAADIQPLGNLRVLRRLRSQFDADQEATDAWGRHWIEQGFSALETVAGDGPFFGGDTPDAVDVCLVPQMYNARRFGCDLAPFPRLVAIDAALQALPQVASAHPDQVMTDAG